MEAASKSHVDAVRMLLGSGADPNARNNRGWTALRTTARGNAEIIRLLKRPAPGAKGVFSRGTPFSLLLAPNYSLGDFP
jgi:ankyrin repeat protein